MNLLRQVRITVERYAMLRPGDRILAAVSGGADSVALLRVLALLAPEYRLELTAAHLNHGLRGEEALQEEAFVRSLSAAMGLACVCKTIDVRSIRKGRSLEEAAREERYRFLKEAAAGCGAGKIATGHHRDDQAETVLMHLIRGSGPGGLKGILPVREDRVIRPLFEVDRREILGFLDREGLSYRTDSSNRDPAFLRNRIRNDLIPALAKDYNPRIVEGLCHAAEILRQQEDYLQRATGRILKRWRIPPGAGEIHVPLENFLNLHESLRGRIIQTLLKAAAPSGRGIAFRHVEAVLDLCRRFRHGRASLDLPFRLVAETGDGSLRIGRDPGGGAREGRGIRAPEYEYPLEIPGEILLREAGSTLRLEWVLRPDFREMAASPLAAFMDYDRIVLPLILRNFRPGDRMDLLGMGGAKKLKSFFIDRKIPRCDRAVIPLLVDARSVIWVAGERISERVKVTPESKNVLKAEMV